MQDIQKLDWFFTCVKDEFPKVTPRLVHVPDGKHNVEQKVEGRLNYVQRRACTRETPMYKYDVREDAERRDVRRQISKIAKTGQGNFVCLCYLCGPKITMY